MSSINRIIIRCAVKLVLDYRNFLEIKTLAIPLKIKINISGFLTFQYASLRVQYRLNLIDPITYIITNKAESQRRGLFRENN